MMTNVAPRLARAEADAGGVKYNRPAFDRQPADGPIVEQHIERQLDNALHFANVWMPLRD